MTWQNQDDKSDKTPQGANPWDAKKRQNQEGPPDPGEALKMLFKRRKKNHSTTIFWWRIR